MHCSTGVIAVNVNPCILNIYMFTRVGITVDSDQMASGYTVFSKKDKSTGLQIRVRIGKLFSLFLIQNICCGFSNDLSQ